ncbi:hypothetical protein ACFSO7_15890 [Bacillus sp. CGMCC 1.16607]|uniref:hypothetical protein n=1 Tax=Bacillus sp. CGMCC 1.16607 TaxID=3351842 RepID=UPI00362DFBF8
MRKKIIALGVLSFVIIITIGYFSVPISYKSVISHSTKIERIYFSYLNGGPTNYYLIEFDDKNADLQSIMSIFDSVTYRKSFGNKNIKNNGKSFMMTVIYRVRNGESNNYDLDINEKGFVVSDKKKYKVVDEEQEFFLQLSTWLLEKGIEQPIYRIGEGIINTP